MALYILKKRQLRWVCGIFWLLLSNYMSVSRWIKHEVEIFTLWASELHQKVVWCWFLETAISFSLIFLNIMMKASPSIPLSNAGALLCQKFFENFGDLSNGKGSIMFMQQHALAWLLVNVWFHWKQRQQVCLENRRPFEGNLSQFLLDLKFLVLD